MPSASRSTFQRDRGAVDQKISSELRLSLTSWGAGTVCLFHTPSTRYKYHTPVDALLVL